MRKTGLALIAMMILAAGCSTTKLLSEDELRLAENKVVITNSNSYNPSSLTPYIKQKSNYYVFG